MSSLLRPAMAGKPLMLPLSVSRASRIPFYGSPFVVCPVRVDPSCLFLRVEARNNSRKESAKIRNRRMQRMIANGFVLFDLKYNGSATKPRLSVFCSNKQLYAMLVDDGNKKILFYASTLQKAILGDPPCTIIEAAQKVGEELIKACKDLNISEILSYDRSGFARGERMSAFEIPISQHGFLLR